MIFLILLISLLLRLILINQSLWLDEAIGVMAAKNLSFSEIIFKFSPGNFHPPFQFILLKLWGSIFGFSEISVRSLSIIASLVTLYLVYRICFIFQGSIEINTPKKVRNFPLLAISLLAINPLFIYYSQDAWVYSLATLIATLTVYLYLTINKSRFTSGSFYLFLVGTLCLYTYYPLSFLIFSLAVHAFFKRTNRKLVFVPFLFSLLFFLPWLPILRNQLHIAVLAKSDTPIWWQVLGTTSLKSVSLVWIKFLIGRISFLTRKGYLAYVLVVSIIPLIGLGISWINKKTLSLLWYWLIIPFALALGLGIFGSGFMYFRLIFILPAFIALIAFGVSRLGRFSQFALFSSFATSLIIFWINPRFHRENWRDAVRFIEANSDSNSATVFINYSQSDPYRYYAKKVPVYSSRDWQINAPNHLWLMRYVQPIFDPEDKLPSAISAAGYFKLRERDFNGVTIWEYKQL